MHFECLPTVCLPVKKVIFVGTHTVITLLRYCSTPEAHFMFELHFCISALILINKKINVTRVS